MDRWYKRSFGFRRRALSYYNERFLFASVPTLSNDIPSNYDPEYGHKLNIISEYYDTYPDSNHKRENIYNPDLEYRYVIKDALYYKGKKRFRDEDPLQPDGRKEQDYDNLFERLDWRKLLSNRLKMKSRI